jgi:sugar transferase EpsL
MKRVFDLVAALAALLLLSPLLAAAALLVRFKLGPPVLFSQARPGCGGRIFTLYKFRTMTEARDSDGKSRPDAERLTGFGRFLRAASVDELPELWNVIRGEMSLVGPRPLLVEYLSRYSPEEARRHEVLPGITGWAQINGRNSTTWQERLQLDVWYVDHRSFWLDLRILARTALLVLRRDGITAPGSATMPEFRPQNQEKKP